MKSEIIITSEELNKDDLSKLLQAIRDCEQSNFKNKQICILAVVPELTNLEVEAILKSFSPGFPIVLRRRI